MNVFVLFCLQFLAVVYANSDNTKPSQVTKESQQIALEVTGDLLPKEGLSEEIAEDLDLIRNKYSKMSTITYKGKWVAGELLATGVFDEQVKKLNESEFGPLKAFHRFNRADVAVLTFNKPYNPEQLAVILKTRFNIDSKPNGARGATDVITYESSSPAIYIFQHGWGDCFAIVGCKNKHFWKFSVSDDGVVKLKKEYGSPLINYVIE